MELDDITEEDVQEEIRMLKETAGGMDQWTPADLKMLPKTACRRLAHMFNAIEKGATWPEEQTSARAAFMAKEEGIELDPQSYRVLLMLPAPLLLPFVGLAVCFLQYAMALLPLVPPHGAQPCGTYPPL